VCSHLIEGMHTGFTFLAVDGAVAEFTAGVLSGACDAVRCRYYQIVQI